MKSTGENHESAFNATAKQSKTAFEKRFSEIIDEIIADRDHTGFAIFIDKNILPNQFPNLKKQISDFKIKLDSEYISTTITLLLPLCKSKKEEGSERREKVLSYNYLLQTYLRCKNRQDHPTIVHNQDHLKSVRIIFDFYKQLAGLEVIENEGKIRCYDHITKNEFIFDQKIDIQFTEESYEFTPPHSFIQITEEILRTKHNDQGIENLYQKFFD